MSPHSFQELWPQGTAVPTVLAHTFANSPFVKPSLNHPNCTERPTCTARTPLNTNTYCVDPAGQNMVPALEKLPEGKCQRVCTHGHAEPGRVRLPEETPGSWTIRSWMISQS